MGCQLLGETHRYPKISVYDYHSICYSKLSEFPEYYSKDVYYNQNTCASTTSTDEGIVATKQAGW